VVDDVQVEVDALDGGPARAVQDVEVVLEAVVGRNVVDLDGVALTVDDLQEVAAALVGGDLLFQHGHG
jgi:hypothetical protein